MAEEETELLPCPHCGCTHIVIDADLLDAGLAQASCSECSAMGPIVKNDMDVIEGKEEQQAFELWNRRVLPDSTLVVAKTDSEAAQRSARAEALRWVAGMLDAQVKVDEADTMRVLVSAGARSRIGAFTEVAVMCRAAAVHAERGKDLSSAKGLE